MGWQNAFHCEIDDFCNTILNYWFKDAKSYTDVATTDFREWRGKINVLTGGFPCQPFSVAGQRKGADDNRYLWPHMLRAIHEIRPDWVIGENVAGILTMVQPGQETEVGSQSTLFGESEPVFKRRQQYVVETICRDLEREGYSDDLLSLFYINKPQKIVNNRYFQEWKDKNYYEVHYLRVKHKKLNDENRVFLE